MTPRVLISLLTGKKEDINLARRRIAYDRLVLISHPGTEDLAEEVHQAETGLGIVQAVEILHLGGHDVRALIRDLGSVADRFRHVHRTLNAAGGHPGLAAAALHVAYDRGIETWYFQEGRAERLPLLEGLELRDRVDALEAKLLRHLSDDGMTSRTLAETLVIGRPRIERAVHALRKKGLVTFDVEGGTARVRRTDAGDHVLEHLRKDPHPARAGRDDQGLAAAPARA